MESSLAICRHLFVDHFLHPGQIPVLFPEGKPALPVPTEEIPLTLIDGASAHRAGSNALPGIKTVLFFHGYFPALQQHPVNQFYDALQKFLPAQLSFFDPEQTVFPLCCHSG